MKCNGRIKVNGKKFSNQIEIMVKKIEIITYFFGCQSQIKPFSPKSGHIWIKSSKTIANKTKIVYQVIKSYFKQDKDCLDKSNKE